LLFRACIYEIPFFQRNWVTAFQIQENKLMDFGMGVILLLIFLGTSFGQSDAAVLSSPDGRLTITFRILSPSQVPQGREVAPIPESSPGSGQLIYEVSFQGNPLIQPSALCLDLKNQALSA
jgi:hypothetical protein